LAQAAHHTSTPRKQEQAQQHTTQAGASPATHHASRSKPSSTPTQAEPARQRWLFSQPNGAKNNQQQQNIVFIKITQQNMKATQKLPDQTTICSALSILA